MGEEEGQKLHDWGINIEAKNKEVGGVGWPARPVSSDVAVLSAAGSRGRKGVSEERKGGMGG